MLSGIREITDVIGDDVGHCKGEKMVRLTKVIMMYKETPSG